jgi:hypothetical protein
MTTQVTDERRSGDFQDAESRENELLKEHLRLSVFICGFPSSLG